MSNFSLENWLSSARSTSGPRALTDGKGAKNDAKDYPRHFMMIGAAASGKTVMMERVFRDIEKGKYAELEGKIPMNVDLRLFSIKQEYTPMQVILGDRFKPENMEESEKKFQMFREHDDFLVLLIDSLDALQYSLLDEKPLIGHDQSAKIDTIIYNLFLGNLMPNAQLITATREYKECAMHDDIRPDRRVYVDGLNEDSVRSLIREHLSERKGNEMLKHVRQKNPNLWPLLATPGYLLMAAYGYESKLNLKPRTMTGIILKYLVRNVEKNPPDCLDTYLCTHDKIKALAYHLMTKGRYFVTENDLAKFRLLKHEVIKSEILESKRGPTKPMEFKVRLEQEFYAGFYTLLMEKDEFYEYIANNIYGNYYAICARVTCSLLYDEDVSKAASQLCQAPFRHVEWKRDQMKEFFHDEFNSICYISRVMELFKILYEGQNGVNDVISDEICNVGLKHQSVSTTEIHIMAFVVTRCGYLNEISLIGCKLDDKKVALFCSQLLKIHLQFQLFDISQNFELGPQSMYYVGQVVEHCSVSRFAASRCRLTGEHMKKFEEGINDRRLESLYVNGNPQLGESGMYRLGRIVTHCLVKNFYVMHCDLDARKWSKFLQGQSDARPRFTGKGSIAVCITDDATDGSGQKVISTHILKLPK